jgi:hypothetical protein
MTDENGAWDTPAGPIDARGPKPEYEHFMYWTSKGSGSFAGLTYVGFWYFPEPEPLQPGDAFIWSGSIDEPDAHLAKNAASKMMYQRPEISCHRL